MATKPAPKPLMTREEWLRALAAKLNPMFTAAGKALPDKLRISVGWPTRKALASAKGRILGQCFPIECSADKHTEIFVSPVVGKALDAAGVLAHELCHAAAGNKVAHRKPFVDLATKLGLEGKPTQCLPGKALRAKLATMIDGIGPYPHATLDMTKMAKKQGRKRWLKITCTECGYLCKTSQKWIDEGLPTCACGGAFEAADGEGSEEDGDE